MRVEIDTEDIVKFIYMYSGMVSKNMIIESDLLEEVENTIDYYEEEGFNHEIKIVGL